MANVRIKDITTTASAPNDDDYLAIDGATAGTRKISANDIAKDKVTGDGITKIMALTQEEYDAISEKDPETLYIITDESGGTDASITNNLTNVTTNNSITTIPKGSPYTATLTPAENYYIDSVTVTMGGNDITSSVYSNGIINIPSVTANVVIVAVGETTFIQVPYLDSDGNSYILTDFKPTVNGLVYEAMMKGIDTGANKTMFGAYAGSNSQLSCLGDGSGWLNMYHDGVLASVKASTYNTGLAHVYKRTATDVYIDDSASLKTVSAGTKKTTNMFAIFGRSDGTYLTSYRLYWVKIYDTDGTTLLHEYVPHEENGVACIYDTVTQSTFYNNGSGTLTYGTELMGD